jgi:hypothetical protein
LQFLPGKFNLPVLHATGLEPATSLAEADLPDYSKAQNTPEQQVTSMEHTRSVKASLPGEDEAGNEQRGWKVTFLDSFAVLAENMRFLLLATLVVGAAAMGTALWLPKVYTSVAFLGPMDEQYAKAAEVVIQSAPVLDSVIGKFPQYRSGYPLEERRDHLAARLSWKIVKGSPPKSAIYTLKFDDTDPHRAQGMLSTILDVWLETIGPRPDNSARLTKSLAASEAQADDLGHVIAELKKRPDAMFADARNNYFPPNIVDMIKMRTETAAKIVELEAALRPGTRDLIFSPPVLPEQPSSPNKKLIVAISMAATLFGLIGFFLLNWSLKLAAEKPVYAPIISRIRGAFRWK